MELYPALESFFASVLPFMLVLTVVVFVHELGHYLVARHYGVRIEVFSIGFGPEIFGFTDRHNTRWKFSLIPMGGYVRMFSDLNAASQPDQEAIAAMTEEDKKGSLFHKTAWQRFQISAAGPLANYLFAIVILGALFSTVGQKIPAENARLGDIIPGSAAAAAKLQNGDIISAIDGQPVTSFTHLREIVMAHPSKLLHLTISRDGHKFVVNLTPQSQEAKDEQGHIKEIGTLGAYHGTTFQKRSFASAWGYALYDAYFITINTLKTFGQMLTGSRSAEGLSGPIGIAILTAKIASKGLAEIIWFVAFISLSLGLFNLLPIPALDGGHLLYNGIEAIRGHPLSLKTQEYGFRIGLVILLLLVVLGTHNDFVNWNIIASLKSFVGL